MGFTLNPIEFILIDLKRSTKNKNFFFFIKALKIKTDQQDFHTQTKN